MLHENVSERQVKNQESIHNKYYLGDMYTNISYTSVQRPLPCRCDSY
jgi:hypothetical protein